MTCKFLVTSLNASQILGLEAREKIELIQRLNTFIKPMYNFFRQTTEGIIQQFSDVFTGVRSLEPCCKNKRPLYSSYSSPT